MKPFSDGLDLVRLRSLTIARPPDETQKMKQLETRNLKKKEMKRNKNLQSTALLEQGFGGRAIPIAIGTRPAESNETT